MSKIKIYEVRLKVGTNTIGHQIISYIDYIKNKYMFFFFLEIVILRNQEFWPVA